MKKIALLLTTALFVSISVCQSQTAKQCIAQQTEKCAGNYYAYPAPQKAQTPPPSGYFPFYLSHYGRHGSRYLINSVDVVEARDVLERAENEGKLTSVGKKVMQQLDVVAKAMNERDGELTPLGHQQHKEIAQRMCKNYPEIFGSSAAAIDARSTQVHRCILSMGTFCQELKVNNPSISITNNASKRDMYYMCKEEHNVHKRSDAEVAWQKAYEAFCDENSHPERLMGVLFKDKNYLPEKKAGKLSRQIFNVACDLQDMPGIDFSLFTLFNEQELYDYWQSQNAYWYGSAGLCTIQSGKECERAANLLRNILDSAEDAINNAKTPTATLRFGHDSGILPLLVLMNVANANVRVGDLHEIQNVWADFKLIPMAANLQLVFYRKGDNSKDVLVKVLLNEEETTLPIKAYSGPYYRWSDVQDYYEDLLSHIRGVEGNKDKTINSTH